MKGQEPLRLDKARTNFVKVNKKIGTRRQKEIGITFTGDSLQE